MRPSSTTAPTVPSRHAEGPHEEALRRAFRGASRTPLPSAGDDGVCREVGFHGRGDLGAEPGPLGHVLALEDLALLVEARDEVTALVGHEDLDLDVRLRQLVVDEGAQVVQAGAGAGRHGDAVLLVAAEPVEHLRVGDGGLVDDDDLLDLVTADLGEHLAHGRDLPLGVGVRAVDDVQEQVGVADLLERRAEGLDELVRQAADEADGVGERVDAAVLGLGAAHRRVEGREQLVLDEHAGAGEPVEQRALAGVGVAGDGDGRDAAGATRVAPRVAARLHALDVAAELGDLRVDPAAVELDLRLTGSTRTDALTTGDAATGLTGHRLTPATQAGQEVLQLGQLDLRAALAALGVLGEDVEDQRRAVDDLHLDDVLERAPLARGELAVADDGVGPLLDDDVAQLERLALAQPRRGVGLLATLDDTLEHRRTGRLGEGRELADGVLGVLGRAVGPDPGQHDPLEA